MTRTRYIVLSLAGALVPTALVAQTTFTSSSYPAPATPVAVASGDLDGDGDADLATVHQIADSVTYNRNLGGGTSWLQGPLFAYPAGSRPQELVIDQLDGVGRPDVAVMLAGTFRVSIHRASGAFPGFLAPQIVPLVGVPVEGVSIDIDLDGDRDLAVITQNPARVYVLRNTAGLFAVAGIVSLPSTPLGIAAGNLNSAGAEDLAVALASGNVAVLLNQSTTAAILFTPTLVFAVDARPYGVCTGDFDGDGIKDIATSNSAFSTATVLLAVTASVTPVSVAYVRTDYPLAPGSIAGPPTEIECTDFDCDSDNDLAVVCSATSNVAFLWNGGGGAFGAPTFAPTFAGCNDDVIDDFDGDLWPDVATSNSSSSSVSVLLNDFADDCCRHDFVGGIIDGFSAVQPNGPEDACPGPALLAYYGGPRRDFDGPVVCSRVFMHTFQRLPGRIKSAHLRMAVRADCTSPGDVFGLGYVGGATLFAYRDTLGNMTGSPWTAGSTGGFSLDLSDLPGGIDLLPKIAAEGKLDIFIRSNTAVDYCYLTMQTCGGTVEMNLNVTPYVTPGVWTWSVSGAPPSGFGYIFLSTAVGPGPLTPWGPFCLVSPSAFQGFATTAAGVGSTSFVMPVPLALPCVQLSAQAVAWTPGFGVVRFSNTRTQQIFD